MTVKLFCQTGPSNIFEFRGEHSTIPPEAAGSTVSFLSSIHHTFEPAILSNTKRRWGVSRHTVGASRRTGHAISPSGTESLADESRRDSEQYAATIHGRSSMDSDTKDKSLKVFFDFAQRAGRRGSDSARSTRSFAEKDDAFCPVAESKGEENALKINPSFGGSCVRKESSPFLHSPSPGASKPIISDCVFASSGAVPDDLDNVCKITPGMDIDDSIVPNTVNDVVVARLDRMSPNEQLILKCASVLGMNFTRELLSAIVPRQTASVLDTTLYRLSKERLIECGTLALNQSQMRASNRELSGKSSHQYHKQEQRRRNQVLCGCYAGKGQPPINLSQTSRQTQGRKKLCLYFHFSNTLVREAAYDLWLEEQRHALHERAAMFLETQIHRCKSCGGTSFVPGIKAKSAYRSNFLVRDLGENIHSQKLQLLAIVA